MSTTTCPSTICSGACGGEEVTVKRGRGSRVGIRESRPTLTYGACSTLIAQGWRGPQLVAWDDAAETVSTVVRHRDGLVGFRA